MIKAIIFDFGQTLVDSADGFRLAEKTAKEILFSRIFPKASTDQWLTFQTEYRQIRKQFHARSELSRPAIWKAVYNRFNCWFDTKELLQMEREYWETIKNLTIPFPETVRVLKELALQFRLGIITNTQGQKSSGSHRITLFPDIEQFFEILVIAGESGLPPKPDSRSFQLCMEKMDLKPDEAIYVGDDFEKDICGAFKAGLHPVWIKHNLVSRSWPEPTTCLHVNIIDCLDELLEIIDIEVTA